MILFWFLLYFCKLLRDKVVHAYVYLCILVEWTHIYLKSLPVKHLKTDPFYHYKQNRFIINSHVKFQLPSKGCGAPLLLVMLMRPSLLARLSCAWRFVITADECCCLHKTSSMFMILLESLSMDDVVAVINQSVLMVLLL